MNLLRPIRRFFGALFLRKRLDVEMDDELRAHIEAQTREKIAAGMHPIEARQKAMREFGGFESVKERCREERPSFWMEEWARDFRFTVRVFAKNPGFAAVTIATLWSKVTWVSSNYWLPARRAARLDPMIALRCE